jgi:hypothetical protein
MCHIAITDWRGFQPAATKPLNTIRWATVESISATYQHGLGQYVL